MTNFMSQSVTQVVRSGRAFRERGIEYDNTVIFGVTSIGYREGGVSKEASTGTRDKTGIRMSART
jgi:hypothetical protein